MGDWEVPGGVPGYELQELLGFGAAGEVWRARERSSGTAVVLRRVTGADKEVVAQLRATATVVRSLPTAHLVRLRRTTRAGRDDVLVLDHAAGGSLAALQARRGRVEPGEVVTALAPLAEALGQAHAHGLVHGRVLASGVLLTAEGMPVLDGLGLSCLHDAEDTLDPTGGLGAAADVWALGALGHLLLSGEQPGVTPLSELAPTAPHPLLKALESALSFDPSARPSALDLAAALLAACPAAPLAGLQVPVTDPIPAPPPGTGPVRRLTTVGVVALVLAAVIAGGWAWGHRSAAQPTHVAAAADWATVLRGLDRARAAAFAAGDAARLDEVYTADSPQLAQDRLGLSAWPALRRTAEGVLHRVRSVHPTVVRPTRVELRVDESLGAYVVRTGSTVERHAAGPLVSHLVVLVDTTDGWRVAEVRLLV